jgi:hypothetical protein
MAAVVLSDPETLQIGPSIKSADLLARETGSSSGIGRPLAASLEPSVLHSRNRLLESRRVSARERVLLAKSLRRQRRVHLEVVARDLRV